MPRKRVKNLAAILLILTLLIGVWYWQQCKPYGKTKGKTKGDGKDKRGREPLI